MAAVHEREQTDYGLQTREQQQQRQQHVRRGKIAQRAAATRQARAGHMLTVVFLLKYREKEVILKWKSNVVSLLLRGERRMKPDVNDSIRGVCLLLLTRGRAFTTIHST